MAVQLKELEPFVRDIQVMTHTALLDGFHPLLVQLTGPVSMHAESSECAHLHQVLSPSTQLQP